MRQVRQPEPVEATASANNHPLVVRTFLFEVTVIIALVELTLMLVLWVLPVELPVLAEAVLDAVILAGVSGPIIWWISIRPLSSRMSSEFDRAELAREELHAELDARDIDAQVMRAMEMAPDEAGVVEVIDIALQHMQHIDRGEVLITDDAAERLTRSPGVGDAVVGCPVETPEDCVVIRSGQGRTFESSDDIDACPSLRGRPGGSISASCMPVSIVGRSVGVLHVTGENGSASDRTTPHLRRLASAAGTRLGLMRALADSAEQAGTDPLTGLANRRTLDEHLSLLQHASQRHEETYGILMIDIDHFKILNDEHGHEAGDRSLRLFGEVLQDVLRSEDMAARYGGEEFVCVLDGTDEHAAGVTANRVRNALAVHLDGSSVPRFSVSVGAAAGRYGSDPTPVMRSSDGALYAAKRNGRNRVELFSTCDGVDVSAPSTKPLTEPTIDPSVRQTGLSVTSKPDPKPGVSVDSFVRGR